MYVNVNVNVIVNVNVEYSFLLNVNREQAGRRPVQRQLTVILSKTTVVLFNASIT